MTLKNNRAPLLSIIKLYASFHHHMWIQTGVTVRKLLSWVLTSVTLTFDPWPWPLAWTSLLSLVITPENFMMIRWREHGEKGVTDGQTDRRTDGLYQSYSCLVAAIKSPFFWMVGPKIKLQILAWTLKINLPLNKKNSSQLRPGDVYNIWWHRSGSTVACCPTAPSHYLKQYWSIIRGVVWHLSQSNSQ